MWKNHQNTHQNLLEVILHLLDFNTLAMEVLMNLLFSKLLKMEVSYTFPDSKPLVRWGKGFFPQFQRLQLPTH
jgi:hypothetical protein